MTQKISKVPQQLLQLQWKKKLQGNAGIWVSIREQRLRLIHNNAVQLEIPCSTSTKGAGQQENSGQTPIGWHEIAEKIGENLPLGSVFESRIPTGEIWNIGKPSEKDLILTRILWLRGLKEGFNKGGKQDSYQRYIYIHGSNCEEKLGSPSSAGCIRIGNKEIVSLFEMVYKNQRVLITED